MLDASSGVSLWGVSSMNHEEIQEWAAAYIDAQQDPELLKVEDHPLWWAVERFMFPGSEDTLARDCLKVILAILEKDPPESVIGSLAAGPLEDLIEECGEEIIEDIETEARKNPAFRQLLGGMWESGKPEVWARVVSARGSAG